MIGHGALKFYDAIDVIDEKAYSVSGLKSEVDRATASLHAIGEVTAGNFSTKYLLDERILPMDKLTIQSTSLQDFFIQLVNNRGGKVS